MQYRHNGARHMQIDDFFVRQAVVFASALIYWLGVMVQARTVRKNIGRQPNVSPRGTREKLLWLGWMLVVVTWISLPFLVSPDSTSTWLQPFLARRSSHLESLKELRVGQDESCEHQAPKDHRYRHHPQPPTQHLSYTFCVADRCRLTLDDIALQSLDKFAYPSD